jgi:hypothetical protein
MRLRSKKLLTICFETVHCYHKKIKKYDIVNNFYTVRDKKSKQKT